MTCNGGGSQARRLWHDGCAAPPGVESFVAPLADSSFCGPVSYLNSPAGFLLERRHVQSTRRRRRKSLEGSERDERGCIDLPACRDARVVPFGLDDTFRGGRLLPLKKRLLFAWCALTLLHGADPARAQFTDAHNYDNTPVGVNQLELGYAFMHANASIDTSLVIRGASLDLNQGTIDYTRYFGLFHRLTWVEAAVPVASLGGSLSGINIEGSTAGAGDSRYAVAMLLIGGPALSAAQFDNYRPRTTAGVSLTVTAPTGRYNADKILNLGSDRWSFKPEIALSHPFGPEEKWQLDAYANAYFYTDNTSYHGREILRQQPLAGLEGHISYSFNDRLWVSLNSRYSFGGTTFVDGADQTNLQQNVIFGSEMNMSIDSRHSLLFEFAKAVVHQNSPAVVGFAVKYDYTWGQGDK